MEIQLENWNIEAVTGYKPLTTFYLDFSIADHFGLTAIQDTFDMAFREYENNYKYITELVMVLNWKIWRWYKHDDDYAKLYNTLWEKLDEWCMDNLKGEELDYYIQTTD